MKMWWILIYATLASNFFTWLHAQDLITSTSTVTVQPKPSFTTITSEVVVSEFTDSLGLTTASTTTEQIGGSPVTSSSSSPPSSSTSVSQPGSTSSNLSTSPNQSSTFSTLPTSSVSSTTSSFTGLPTGNFTEVHVHEGLTVSDIGSIMAVVIAVFQGCLLGLFVWWWQKRKPFLHEPEEDSAWWIHPVYKFRRLLPKADTHTPRRTEPRVAVTAHEPPRRNRPKISNPIPINQRPRTPLSRPHRPLSLTESLMEEMRTSPQPRANRDRREAAQAGDVDNTFGTDDVSSGPGGSELETTKPIPIPIPPSTRSSTNNYGTFLSGIGRPPKPVYLPYCESDSPPPGRMDQRNLLRYPTQEQSHVLPDDIHQRFRQHAPIGDEDEDDEEIKRLRRDESLRVLEENSATRSVNTLGEIEEEESASQGSFDFAEARARKILADKRMREDFARGEGRAGQGLTTPPLPELFAVYRP